MGAVSPDVASCAVCTGKGGNEGRGGDEEPRRANTYSSKIVSKEERKNTHIADASCPVCGRGTLAIWCGSFATFLRGKKMAIFSEQAKKHGYAWYAPCSILSSRCVCVCVRERENY